MPALFLDETTKLLSRKAAWIIPQTIEEIHQVVFISSQRGVSYAAVLPHPRQELLEQGRSSFLEMDDHGWQNTDPPQMFDKPLSPSNDKRRPPAYGSWAFALRQVKTKARNEIVVETLHVDLLSSCPNTQVRSSSKNGPDRTFILVSP